MRSGFEGLGIVSAFGERRMVGPTPPRRGFGVPPGGPFDRLSAALVRALVGRSEEETVLEIALGPVVFEAREPLTVAIVGGPDGSFPLAAGERLEVRPEGARAYVAAPKAAQGPRTLAEGTATVLRARVLADPPRLDERPLRVVRGPQADVVDFEGFLEGSYVVGLASNRVGVRLEGNPRPHELSLPSEPAIPGAIQVPPNGQPIVLGPDGPTIGGYPKIAVVVDADLDRIGRARPGDRIAFEVVGLEEARALGQIMREDRARRCAELRALSG